MCEPYVVAVATIHGLVSLIDIIGVVNLITDATWAEAMNRDSSRSGFSAVEALDGMPSPAEEVIRPLYVTTSLQLYTMAESSGKRED